MDNFIRTLDDYAEIVNRMHEYGYIGNIGEGKGRAARHFNSDYLITLIKTGNVEPIIIERDCDNYPYRMEVNVGAHTLYCLLRQREYEALIADGILTEEVPAMAKYKLGDRVRVQRIIEAEKYWDYETRYTKRKWVAKEQELTGIIVGHRYVQEGIVGHGPDYSTFVPENYIECYLVAYDLHRKPAHVLPEDIEVLENEIQRHRD